MVRGVVIGIVALVALVLVLFPKDSDAMKQCQVNHSYDTCFQLLNR